MPILVYQLEGRADGVLHTFYKPSEFGALNIYKTAFNYFLLISNLDANFKER